MRNRLGHSERRVCKVLRQARSTQRYRPGKYDRDRHLIVDMLRLSQRHPRYGYRRIGAMLRKEGWRVNLKRVYRLWREEGLKVPRKQRKRRRLGSTDNSCMRKRAVRKNHVWSYDFVMDRTEDGRPLKILAVVDEYTRECLALHVGRKLKSDDVIGILLWLFFERRTPEFIRSDNGPEFVARAVRKLLKDMEVKTLYIEPGSPWENAYIESFNGKLRDELLNRELFLNLVEARYVMEQWREEYNNLRPHSSLMYQTPAGFSEACVPSGSASLRRKERHNCLSTESLS